MAGALEGLTIIELAAIGPCHFAAMMLADHGARVIRVERPGAFGAIDGADALMRGREVVWLDLKQPDGVATLLKLAEGADALIEGNRPGVIERLGIGPDALLACNPRIVIGRMTGWGQQGPLASSAGHDITYTALSGALHTYGPRERPMAPTNAIGDYGGGGMLLAFGVLAGLLSARTTGRGQEIDCAMLDGAALLSAMTYTLLGAGMWRDAREANVIDGGAWFYGTYETADRRFVAVGPLEPQFRAILIERLGLAGDPDFVGERDPADWPRLRARVAAIFRERTRDAWCALFDGTDACVAPVLGLLEAPRHPHNLARGTFVEADGLVQPAPAPRFSATPAPPVRMTRRPDGAVRGERDQNAAAIVPSS